MHALTSQTSNRTLAPRPGPRAGKLPAGWERNKEKPAAWIFSTVKRFLAIITPPVAASFVRLREVRPDVVDNLDDQVIEYIINLGPSRYGAGCVRVVGVLCCAAAEFCHFIYLPTCTIWSSSKADVMVQL
jgi:hypothetical protein